MKDYLKWYGDSIIKILLIVLTVGVACCFAYNHIGKLHQAQALTAAQAQDIAVLENKLNVSKVEAESLQAEIKKAQEGKVKPVDSYTVSAPSDYEAAEKVAGQINNKDPAVPAAALEKTDRTIVAPQPDNKEYQVGVYKANLYKGWGFGSGLGTYDGEPYIPLGIERNFSKDESVTFQISVDPQESIENGKLDIKGGQVMYWKKTNKVLWF